MKQQILVLGVTLVAITLVVVPGTTGQAPPEGEQLRPVAESFYKIAPGKTDEWLELYRTQHLPILEERKREEHILEPGNPAVPEGGRGAGGREPPLAAQGAQGPPRAR